VEPKISGPTRSFLFSRRTPALAPKASSVPVLEPPLELLSERALLLMPLPEPVLLRQLEPLPVQAHSPEPQCRLYILSR
jgi:hypothetical protein